MQIAPRSLRCARDRMNARSGWSHRDRTWSPPLIWSRRCDQAPKYASIAREANLRDKNERRAKKTNYLVFVHWGKFSGCILLALLMVFGWLLRGRLLNFGRRLIVKVDRRTFKVRASICEKTDRKTIYSFSSVRFPQITDKNVQRLRRHTLVIVQK